MDKLSFNAEPKHIKGISCSVSRCAYHDGVSFCTASKISVGPATAQNCAQTVCATFKPRQQ